MKENQRYIVFAYGAEGYADRRWLNSDWLQKGFSGDRRKKLDRRTTKMEGRENVAALGTRNYEGVS